MARVFSNLAQRATLSTSHGSGNTTLNVDSTDGWPSPGAGDIGIGALDYDNANIEIFSYTGKTATTFTGVTRGLDGTSAVSHALGAPAGHIYSVEDLGRTWQVAAFSTDQTVARSSYTHIVDAASGAIIMTLPAAAAFDGIRFEFKKKDSTTNTVTVKGNGSELVDAANTYLLTAQYDSVTVVSDGTQWWII